ncbi:hypothetical protein EDD17DRAFT_1597005 [Pisolithus thermaeus]|nr:hypothetical protein EDD17DRAFT_1597005 [Pisolithus thermaeus]
MSLLRMSLFLLLLLSIVCLTLPCGYRIFVSMYSFCASRLIIHTRESFARSSHDALSREIEPINFASRSLMASHAASCA